MRSGLITDLDRYTVYRTLLCSDVILLPSFIEYLPIDLVYRPTLHEYHCLKCVVYSYVQRVYFEHFTRLGAIHICTHYPLGALHYTRIRGSTLGQKAVMYLPVYSMSLKLIIGSDRIRI